MGATMSHDAVCAQVDIAVPFHDVDPMQVVWHGHYLKYFELARCALLDRIDYNYRQMQQSGYVWPVIEAHVRYPGRAEFAQRLRVQATLVEWENRLRIAYLVSDAATGKRLTTGYTIQVAVQMPSGDLQFESPAILRQKIESLR
jgi:acyl-CoA thioester hydrolase